MWHQLHVATSQSWGHNPYSCHHDPYYVHGSNVGSARDNQNRGEIVYIRDTTLPLYAFHHHHHQQYLTYLTLPALQLTITNINTSQ